MPSAPRSTKRPKPQIPVNALPKKSVSTTSSPIAVVISTIAYIAVENAPKTSKLNNWITVQGKGSKKSLKSGNTNRIPLRIRKNRNV